MFGAFKKKFLKPNLTLFLKGRRGEGRGKRDDDGGSRGNLGLTLLGCLVQRDFSEISQRQVTEFLPSG